MRKKTRVFLLLFCLAGLLWAADIPAYFPSLHQTAILPEIPGFGKVWDNSDSDPLLSIRKALTSEYDFSWAETYLDPQKKKALVYLNNDFLSETLPLKEFFFAQPIIENGVCKAKVLLPEQSLVLDILLDLKTKKILYLFPSPFSKDSQ